jgi:hypothetical protein
MEKAAELVRGAYVRVHGKVGEFEGRWRVQAFHVRLVTDFNEARSRSPCPHDWLFCCRNPCLACTALFALSRCAPMCAGLCACHAKALHKGPQGEGETARASVGHCWRTQVTYHNLQAIFQAVHVAKGLPGSGRPLAEVRLLLCTKPHGMTNVHA